MDEYSDDTRNHIEIDKQEFVKILASATGLEPIMKHIYRGS